MRLDQVANLSQWEVYLYWIKERESIRRKKVLGLPKPWTDDRILQTYKFCNVRRMDDKVSLWLYNKWYKPHRNHKNMLLACALARFINKPESLELVTKVVFGERWDSKKLLQILREYKEEGNKVFNGAYMVRGNNGVDKLDSVINANVAPLQSCLDKIDSSSMEKTWNAIIDSFGIGSFMGGQIVADLRWALTGKWADKLVWAPAGPGSRRGMCKLLGLGLNTTGRKIGKRPAKTMSQETFLKNLREIIKISKTKLPNYITDHMEAIDWQNTLCEYDKYTRVVCNEGRPKQLYPGASDDN